MDVEIPNSNRLASKQIRIKPITHTEKETRYTVHTLPTNPILSSLKWRPTTLEATFKT